jgi:hypothetical protein
MILNDIEFEGGSKLETSIDHMIEEDQPSEELYFSRFSFRKPFEYIIYKTFLEK